MSNDLMDWEGITPDFAPDGSLRDIIVPGASISDWQRFLDAFPSHIANFTFTLDGEVSELPTVAEEALALGQRVRPLLSFDVGRVRLHCHFFLASEIEFDFDPREVNGGDELGAISDFIAWIANTTGKMAILTAENAPTAIILGKTPGSADAVWWPQAGKSHH